MDILSWLSFGWVGSMIGLAGIILAVFFYLKSNKKAEPCYQWRTNTIIGDINDDISSKISITFDSVEINDLKRTVIAFWNNGSTYIDNDLVLKENPISISFADGSILSHKIKCTSSESIVATSEIVNDKIIIDFNYLNKNDAICIEILHTSSEVEPSISGTIKGVKCGVLNKGRIFLSSAQSGKKIGYLFPVLGGVIFLAGVISFYVDGFKNYTTLNVIIELNDKINTYFQQSNAQSWLMMLMGLMYGLLPVLMKFYYRNKTPQNIDLS